ncbi:MAG: nucleotidyltransferase domain-containing protein [Ruminococcus sp.]|jgi:predicted nucleotidyltransferase|nr:nucleotidyltransferase domain-containing protein [Ruminococcus sp.]
MIYTIDEIKERIRPVAEKYNLPAVYLFGSYARGEADDKSDVDILVDIDGTGIKGLWKWYGLIDEFKRQIKKRMDVVDAEVFNYGKNQKFINNVKKDMVRIYER